jgi:FAD synthase
MRYSGGHRGKQPTALWSSTLAAQAIGTSKWSGPTRPVTEEKMNTQPLGRATSLRGAQTLRLAASVVTIGAFDGVHRGHQELIRQTALEGTGRGLPSVVYTFDTPPKVYFGQAEPLITLPQKLARIAAFGVDHIIVAHFGQDYARRTAADFIAELGELNPRLILVGEDFRFGSCKSGTVTLLGRHFETRTLPPVRCGAGEIVSSSRIRSLKKAGLAAAAAALEGWKGMIGAGPADMADLSPARRIFR